VISGFAALVLLVMLLVGVPIWLTTVAGSPMPSGLPTWDEAWHALTRRDDGTLLLTVLKYVAWAGWGLFAASVGLDLLARVRRVSPPRLGPQQQLATQLVGAVAALLVAVPSLGGSAPTSAVAQTVATAPAAPAEASRGGAMRGDWVTALATPTSGVVQATDAPTATAAASFTEYMVRPGDCLWDIAWNELGEPERWPELYEASRRIQQPDGRHMTDPDLIYPGWLVRIPIRSASADQASGTTAVPPEPREAPPARHVEPPTVRTPLSTPNENRTQDPNANSDVGAPLLRTPLTTDPPPGTTLGVGSVSWARSVASHDLGLRVGRWRQSLGAKPDGLHLVPADIRGQEPTEPTP
jgi:hypothetical protein